MSDHDEELYQQQAAAGDQREAEFRPVRFAKFGNADGLSQAGRQEQHQQRDDQDGCVEMRSRFYDRQYS